MYIKICNPVTALNEIQRSSSNLFGRVLRQTNKSVRSQVIAAFSFESFKSLEGNLSTKNIFCYVNLLVELSLWMKHFTKKTTVSL